MPNRPAFVFDTNAVVSAALLKESVSRRALDRALGSGELVVSLDTMDELNRVLGRGEFMKYVTEDERMEFLTLLLRESRLVKVTAHVVACRDPRDNKFLELALSGRASHIVTGDSDLLVLHPFRGIAIVSPKWFLAIPDVQGPKAG